jgi:hypothetical protein
MKIKPSQRVVFGIVGILLCSFAVKGQASMGSAEDSSVGKQPVLLAEIFGISEFEIPGMNSSIGKPPTFVIQSGPPPHSKGPGLNFNTHELFYVYTDKRAPQNHFAPSGWMGDYGDIAIDDASPVNPADGKTCFKIHYSAAGSQHAGWAGMYWQEPVNNWGNKSGGYNLAGFKRLTFWARGEVGGEMIASFSIGGIHGVYDDTGSMEIGPVILTPDWQKYTIDLADVDLSQVSERFGQ